MALLPGRDEEKLAVDLAKIRATARIRLGGLAGVVAVGLFQTTFPSTADMDMVTAARALLRAVLPILLLGTAGVVVTLGLARRDTKRKQAEYESKQFRVPTRAKRR